MSPRPKLPEPIVVSTFWKNRGGECIRVSLKEYEGQPIVDARVHVTNAAGVLQPTPRGLACSVRRLPDLAKAMSNALTQARRLGLLPTSKRGSSAGGVHFCDRCLVREAETIEPTQRGFQFLCADCPLPDAEVSPDAPADLGEEAA